MQGINDLATWILVDKAHLEEKVLERQKFGFHDKVAFERWKVERTEIKVLSKKWKAKGRSWRFY